MELSNDNALCAIDNKSTTVCNHGDFAHVDIFFCGVVSATEAELDVEGSTVGFASADGCKIRCLRGRNLVVFVFQLDLSIVTFDGEMVNED